MLNNYSYEAPSNHATSVLDYSCRLLLEQKLKSPRQILETLLLLLGTELEHAYTWCYIELCTLG